MHNSILIICPFVSPNQGGVESHIQKLLAFIGRKEHESIVATYKPLTTPVKGQSYEIQENYEVYRMPWFGMGLFAKIEHNPILTFGYLVPGLLILSLWIGWRKRSEYSVIHAHGMAAGVCGVVLKWVFGKRLVISTHAIYNLKDRKTLGWFLRQLFKQCDKVLAVGEPSKEEIVALGIDKMKVEVHPNWVETDFFKPAISKEIKNKIIWVGRGLEKKGLFLVGELAKRNPNWQFLAIVGDGPDKEKFIEKFGELENLEIKTSLPSNFDEKMNKLANEYRECGIFVMPSLYEEGFAAVVLEAASSGLAIVSSNLGCLPSMLVGSGASLVKPTVENFEEELKKLLKSEELLKEKQKKMREFAIKNFGDANAEVIWRSYEM